MRSKNRPHEVKSRPFGGQRRAWGHVSRHCVYCDSVGPRVPVAGGFAHRRCINELEAMTRLEEYGAGASGIKR